MGDYVLHLERMLNEMKFHRQKKQITRDQLQNEYTVSEEMENREQVLFMVHASAALAHACATQSICPKLAPVGCEVTNSGVRCSLGPARWLTITGAW